MKKLSGFFFIVVFLFTSTISYSQELSEPEQNFEYLWKTLDQRYALFLPKRIDWNLLYRVYRPKVTPETTDDELFLIMSNMLGHLNDLHVRLESQNPMRMYRSGKFVEVAMERFGSIENFFGYFMARPIQTQYIRGELQERHHHIFAYAWLTDDIGYFHFNKFSGVEESARVVDEIVDCFKTAKGLIIDVRRNEGGDDEVGKTIAARFADKKRLYMMKQEKDGPAHDDFAKAVKWFVEPDGPVQFTKPIILLTDMYSISSAETFALAIRVLPHATIVGDFTSGCFADTERDELPNGWYFYVSKNLIVDHTGFCWEGIGVPPDIRIANSRLDDENGKDRVLELAIELIQSGALKPFEKVRQYPVK